MSDTKQNQRGDGMLAIKDPERRERVPVRRMDFIAEEEPGLALAVEIAENEVRRAYTAREVRVLADRLKAAGFRAGPGRPRKGEKPLVPALEAVIKKSRTTLMRILAEDGTSDTENAMSACAGRRKGDGMKRLTPRRTAERVCKRLSASVVAALAVVVAMPGSASAQGSMAREYTLEEVFAPIIVDLGQLNLQRAMIADGPRAVKMKRGGTPGRQWDVSLGISRFLVTVEDGANVTIEEAVALAEKIPVRYRRALVIASGNEVDEDALKDRRNVKPEAIEKANAAKKDREGLALYAAIESPTCTGDSLAMAAGATPELLARAAGLLLASRCRKGEADLFDRWDAAAKADGIRVSKAARGADDSNPRDDIMAFAGLYAHAIDHLMGRGQQEQMQKLSPERYKLWQHVLETTGTKRLYLEIEYDPIGGELRDGLGNTDGAKARITSLEPKSMAIKKFDWSVKKVVEIPVKTYEGIIGDTKFKVSLEDVDMDLGLDDAKRLIESLPPPMRGGLTAISEEGEFGLTLYKGGAAYGVSNRIAMGGRNLSALVFAHECGHTIDQLTNQRDQKLRQLWGIARLIDDVRVSGYGDGPIHEDQAEFAKTYAIAYAYDHTAAANRITTKAKLDCPEISKTGYLNHLRELSPIRFAVFEQMCVVTGGMKEGDTAPSPDIDLDAVRRKMIDLGERMRPAIEQVQETVKRICEKREG